jgi:hypothetical protein
MSKQDVTSVVADLDRWAIGQFGPKLTWEMLEDRFGFSRQSLQAKPEIKLAYDFAKKALSTDLSERAGQTLKSSKELMQEIERLQFEIEKYQRLEAMWKARWQRIAFNIRQRGYQINLIDASAPKDSNPLSDREIKKILGDFDQEIPASGRI